MKQHPVEHFGEQLAFIPLPQKMPGFDRFINAWLVNGERTYLIDPGPTVTIPILTAVLQDLGIRRLDAILLTHIHIDHSGGVGDLVAHFPNTKVVCHARAVEHLVDPARLWAGSVATLGDTARAYGPIAPVPADQVVAVEHLAAPGIEAILTPGHAVHHVSYLIDGTLFAGEAPGFYRELPGGYYLRPATPPKFYLETSLESIQALAKIPCQRMCFGHFGLTRQPAELLRAHRRQLRLWAAELTRFLPEMNGSDQVAAGRAALLERDPLLNGFSQFSDADQQRELGFMANSVRGFQGYLQKNRDRD